MHLTRRQLDVITFVRDFRRKRGLSPTLDEIATHLGVTKVTVFDHLRELEAKGAVTRTPFHSRSVRLTPDMLRELADDAWGVRPLSAVLSRTAARAAREEVDLAEVLQLSRARSLVRVDGQVDPAW